MAVLSPLRPDAVVPRRQARSALREQVLVAAGQGAAGAGNLLFALVLARTLPPGAFANLSAFLALYLLLHLPATSLSAGAALRPRAARRHRRKVALLGAAAGLALALAAPVLAALLSLPVALLLVLAAAAPAAGLIAVDRGRLFGLGDQRGAIASLLAEPGVRLGAGVALSAGLGALGGSVAVVLAGYAALAVAARALGSPHPARTPGVTATAPSTAAAEGARRERPAEAEGSAWATVVGFALVALIQTQDLLLANRLLGDADAGTFAVLSTLGGIAVFATATVPLVLLPRAAAGERQALASAVGVAAALGGGAVLATAVAPAGLVTAAFGARYAAAATAAVPYMGAMALLGVARVLLAARFAAGARGLPVALLAMTAGGHAALVLTGPRTVSGVANATLLATGGLTAVLAVAAVATAPPGRRLTARSLAAIRAWHPVAVRVVSAATLLGLVVRLLVPRGLWVDEAISVSQAVMPFGEMLTDVRYTDVHPPLHHVTLWVLVRVLGTTELAVRLPSILAGTLLVPLLYLSGKALYDRRTGLWASALGAVAPMVVWYSQEARMYAFFMLFAVAAIWAQMRAIQRGRPLDWALYALASAGMLWTQYFALLSIGVQQLAIGVIAYRGWRARGHVRPLLLGWGAATLALVLAAVPLLPILSDQIGAYGNRSGSFGGPALASSAAVSGGDDLSVYAVAANLVWAVWGYHTDPVMEQVVALWPVLMLGGLMALGRGRSPSTTLLVAFAAAPAVVLFGLGLAKRDLFELRYFLLVVPVALLLLGRGLASLPPRTWPARALAGVVGATLLCGLADQQLNPAVPRLYGFSETLADVRERAEPGDVLLYEPWYLDSLVSYYARDLPARSLDDVELIERASQMESPTRMRAAIETRTEALAASDAGRIYVLASFREQARHADRLQVALDALDRSRVLVETLDGPNVDVWIYE